MQFDKEFDASGLSCPMPIVKTKKALSTWTAGRCCASSRPTPDRCATWLRSRRRPATALLSSGEETGKYVFFLRKG